MTDKSRRELVEEFLNKSSEPIYSTDDRNHVGANHPALPIEVLANAVRATNSRFRGIEIKIDFTCNYGPSDGVSKVYLNYRSHELQSLLFNSTANQDVNFQQKLADAKSAHESVCAFFYGYIKAIEDYSAAAKLAAEAPLKRELEMRSEFEYKRSSRY